VHRLLHDATLDLTDRAAGARCSCSAVIRWMHQAGADWNRYVGDIARSANTNPDEYHPTIKETPARSACLEHCCYGSCRSLPWQLVGVGMPALVGLLGSVLVTASPL
jgi:hypothetical protein